MADSIVGDKLLRKNSRPGEKIAGMGRGYKRGVTG
jgi:hypothetical protein